MSPPSLSVLGIIFRYTRPQPIAMSQIRKAEAKINTVTLSCQKYVMPQGMKAEGPKTAVLQSIISEYSDISIMIMCIFIYMNYTVLDFLSPVSLGQHAVMFM